jgi:hypothetical protein
MLRKKMMLPLEAGLASLIHLGSPSSLLYTSLFGDIVGWWPDDQVCSALLDQLMMEDNGR